jgi:LysM repeat protein
VSVSDLLEWNDLDINSTLRLGQEIVVSAVAESS